MGAEVFACGRKEGRTDGQTDVAKLMVSFSNFANAPKHFFFSNILILFAEKVKFDKARGML